jgi:hypothetical protein
MFKRGVVKSVALSGTATQIVGPSDARVALIFSSPTGTSQIVTFSTDANVALNGGLNLTPGSGMLVLTEDVCGDAVRSAWYGIASGTLTVGYLETISG